MRRERLTGRSVAREGGSARGLGGRPLGGDLILGDVGLQLLELEKARGALRAWPVNLAPELGDLEPLVRDRRRVIGRLGSRQRQLGLDPGGPDALSSECRSECLDVGW